MFRILKLVLLAAAVNAAPGAFIPFAQPYYFIGSQPQATFQYQPIELQRTLPTAK